MKISSSQMFRNFNKWCLGAATALFMTGTFNSHAQGGDLFKAKCATCHQVFKDGTGPKLYQVRTKWEEGGAKEGSIIQWVQNWEVAAANDPYALQVSKVKASAMNAFPTLTEEQVISILDWVDEQEETVATASIAGGAAASDVEEESSLGWVWIIIGAMFVVIILSVGGVRRQLKNAEAEASGSEFDASMSYADEFKLWAWKNRKYVGLGGLVVVVSIVVTLFLGLYSIGVVEGYQPSQPINYPHSVHAGEAGIDCRYCHNSVTESKSAGIPSVNVCMNCHKQIAGTGEQVAEIQKIYDAAGWDPEAGVYTGKTQPIVWNKVHVLPDHVYFNHRQHVNVGGVDCKQCHGDMTQQMETAMVMPVEELNKIEGNVTLSKPTMTMGWCIECHHEKEVAMGPLYKEGGSEYYNEIHRRLMSGDKSLYSQYLEDGKVTVEELGGWECAKCHY